jgi:hypothetical protein
MVHYYGERERQEEQPMTYLTPAAYFDAAVASRNRNDPAA